MNPFLEQDDAWHDFHEQFCMECRALLIPQIEPAYIAKLDEHIYIHELSSEERRFLGRGDVTVGVRAPAAAAVTVGTVTAAPVYGRILPAVDIERETRIEIRDRRTRELVTVIEVLSPANKQLGSDRRQYLNKRQALTESPVHLVEIDLLRGGPRLPVEDLPACDYYAVVSRAPDRPRVEIWPIRLRDPLPRIPVPLRSPDPDSILDLQQALHRAYDTGGYRSYIYSGRPAPPLPAGDAAWAGEMMLAAGIPH
jgi:hypothetical protein